MFRLGSNWERLGNSHRKAGSSAMPTDKMSRNHDKEFTSDCRETEGGSFNFEELLQNTQDSLGGAAQLTPWVSILMVIYDLGAGLFLCAREVISQYRMSSLLFWFLRQGLSLSQELARIT